jgi:diguanylate cyclase (GGDEF)-like protein/PAS domain S-box-containing protein
MPRHELSTVLAGLKAASAAGAWVLSVGKNDLGEKGRLRRGKLRLTRLDTFLDRALNRWRADDTQFEKPLRMVFLSFLFLTVFVLTVQNIVSEYRNLNEPQNLIAGTAERLLMQQSALGSETLDQVADNISDNATLQGAIRRGDLSQIRKVADSVFAKKSGALDISEFAIYSANQNLLYRAKGSIVSSLSDPAHQADLPASLFSKSNGIELDENNKVVLSVLRPWFAEGQLLGYLKLSIDIERSLALASSAVNAQIVKICEITNTDVLNSGANRYKVIGELSSAGFKFDALNTKTAGIEELNRFYLQNGKVFMIRDLPILSGKRDQQIKLVLVKNITENVWAFLQGTLLSLIAGFGLASLSWLVIRRLLARLQSSVQLRRERLEAEVVEYTKKLEHNAVQLLEAQRIASVGSWERDIETNEVQCTEEYFRIMDLSPDLSSSEIIEKVYTQIPAHELQATKMMVQNAIDRCGEFDFEHSLMLDNDTLRYLHVRGYVLSGPDGKAQKVIGTIHDITDRFKAERQSQLLANILESSLNEIYILNAETFQIEYANKCALKNLGYSIDELKAHRIWDINPVYDQEKVQRNVKPLLSGKRDSLTVESLHRRKNGSEYPVDLQVQLLKDHDRSLFVAIANDVSERVQRETETREAKVRAERLAYFDSLTKLSNRAGCQRDAKERFSRPEKPAFLVHVDMDNFKRVNDTLGHLAGDHCLEETGRRLREVSRGLGTPYRWGGDEFVIIADSHNSDPNELCERARRLMRMPMEFSGNRFWPTVSMGIALCPEDASDFDTLLVNADLALYQSKENGKDRLTFYKPDMRADSETEARVERELNQAIKNDQFFLVFQPQVNLRSQTVTGIEALIRWDHPDKGIVAPGDFLPIVEKSNLAPLIGELVIDKSLAAARQWLDAGLEFGRVSVNISPSHLASGMLVEHFKAGMKKYDIGPDRITAEVLESVFLNDNASGHLTTLRELYELGVHIELDDFGTGYASLTHVADLPINGLKIDRSFTKQMLDDPKKEAVVNQLIHLARSLNIGIVCEGVETEAQYDRLRMMGDFSVQGYLVSKPMTFDQATDWMSESADDLYFVL